jgi:hypothetical protein
LGQAERRTRVNEKKQVDAVMKKQKTGEGRRQTVTLVRKIRARNEMKGRQSNFVYFALNSSLP